MIAKKSRIKAQDSCYTLLYCKNNLSSLDIPAIISRLLSQRSPQLMDQLMPEPIVKPYGQQFKPKISREPTERVRRQSGIIKILQITDVHVDFQYKVVRWLLLKPTFFKSALL